MGGNFLDAGGAVGNLQAPWEEENLLEEEGAGLGVGVACGEKRVPSLDLLSAPPRVVEELGPEGEKVFGGFLGGDLEVEVERGEVLGGEEEDVVEGLGPSLSFTVFPSFLAFFSSIFSCQVFFRSGTKSGLAFFFSRRSPAGKGNSVWVGLVGVEVWTGSSSSSTKE